MSKKRTWSEEELDNKILTCAIAICVGIVVFSLFSIIIIQNQYGNTWQPINCVNETETVVSISCPNNFIIITKNDFANRQMYVDMNCTISERQVSTGRQICSQEVLVRDRAKVIETKEEILTSKEECELDKLWREEWKRKYDECMFSNDLLNDEVTRWKNIAYEGGCAW